jgi:CDP-paratose 2-epimerase
MNKTIVVTGGAGFIGANFALHYKKQHPEDNLICFDNLNRKGSELNVPRLEQQGITFIKGDVRKREDLQFNEKIDVIVECSAEPSVLAGLKDSPEYVIDTNLGGAINCLELARKNKSKFIFLSTSRVYPYNLLTKLKCEKSETRFKISEDNHIFGLSQEGINEEFPLIGIRSIYGTTKLCAEQLIQEYGEAFGMEYVINRCGVVAGP